MSYIIVAVLYAASEWKLVPTARIAVVVVQSDCRQLAMLCTRAEQVMARVAQRSSFGEIRRTGGGCPRIEGGLRVINYSPTLSYTMSLSALFCQARPDVTPESSYSSEMYNDELPMHEKEELATDEDEMQQRLSDLRREVSDAKVDW
jgi:hypothetical protein